MNNDGAVPFRPCQPAPHAIGAGFAPRLAVFDLDGTLLASLEQATCSPRVKAALQRALSQGVTVTLASGRMFRSLQPFALELGLTAPLLCYQGAWIQSPTAPEPLLRRTLPPDVARRALTLAETRGWHVMLYAGDWLYLREKRFADRFYTELLGHYRLVQDWGTVLTREAVDKVLCVAEEAHIPHLMAEFSALLQGEAGVVRSHRYLMEVIPAGVSKGQAVAWLAQHLGIPREHVLAVGDQENDIEMLRWAGCGVAMGNAPEQVKAVADWVAPTVEEDGAAVALEAWLTGER